MTNQQHHKEISKKIFEGLKLVSKRLIEEKKRKNLEVVIMEGDEIKVVRAVDL